MRCTICLNKLARDHTHTQDAKSDSESSDDAQAALNNIRDADTLLPSIRDRVAHINGCKHCFHLPCITEWKEVSDCAGVLRH